MNHSRALPVTIISGYLGAGKTTLVNHLLRHAEGRKIVVLVNDFGDLPIDAELIESAEGDTLNLTNGCACCAMGGDLFNALVDVLDRKLRPDHLLIEASGVADPVRIANIARAEPDLCLDAIIGLIDGQQFTTQINDPLIGETVSGQLAGVNLVLLNKLDLVSQSDKETLYRRVGELALQARQIETTFSKVPVEALLGLDLAIDHDPVIPEHDQRYMKWSMMLADRIDRDEFEQALSRLSATALRVKGFVRFTGDEAFYVVQCVGGHCTLEPNQNLLSRPSRLVAIGLKGRLDVDNFGTLNADKSGT
jgi:G3E family GTPase